jgi:tRNA/rRNA methyltransferase
VNSVTKHPTIILVEPQLAENIGMAARAMANFGLSELRLVAPRNGWPKKGAHSAASGATHILESARLYATVREAIADLNFVFATTARERGQMKRVFGPEPALREAQERLSAGQGVGILFGRERTGLENDEVSLADAILTFPVDPRFSSVNLAQAVLLVAYEWRKVATGGALPFAGDRRSPPADRETVLSFFDYLEAELDAVNFYPADKRPTMTRNMRDIFHRLELTEQDVRTLRGAIRALAEGRRLRKP